jgi:RNA-binding protein
MGKNAKQDLRQLRAIGHKLKPVVTVAGDGLSAGVKAELERALDDHELIKIRLVAGSREARDAVVEQICRQLGAEMIQRIGNVALIMRRCEKPDPKLSNLIRPV